MVHRIQAVTARENCMLEAVFFGGEIKRFDMKRLFSSFPQFRRVQQEQGLFEKVTVDAGGYGVSWDDALDLDAETVWEGGVLIEVQQERDVSYLLAYRLAAARLTAHMTQKELAEKTGIYQADISKIERGLANPSVQTLKRLADGLGMDLYIDFTVRK